MLLDRVKVVLGGRKAVGELADWAPGTQRILTKT